MNTPLDLMAREVGLSRRAAADQAAQVAAVRLADREQTLHRRLARVHGRLATIAGR